MHVLVFNSNRLDNTQSSLVAINKKTKTFRTINISKGIQIGRELNCQSNSVCPTFVNAFNSSLMESIESIVVYNSSGHLGHLLLLNISDRPIYCFVEFGSTSVSIKYFFAYNFLQFIRLQCNLEPLADYCFTSLGLLDRLVYNSIYRDIRLISKFGFHTFIATKIPIILLLSAFTYIIYLNLFRNMIQTD